VTSLSSDERREWPHVWGSEERGARTSWRRAGDEPFRGDESRRGERRDCRVVVEIWKCTGRQSSTETTIQFPHTADCGNRAKKYSAAAGRREERKAGRGEPSLRTTVYNYAGCGSFGGYHDDIRAPSNVSKAWALLVKTGDAVDPTAYQTLNYDIVNTGREVLAQLITAVFEASLTAAAKAVGRQTLRDEGRDDAAGGLR
jgi:hypothetical protein